MKKIALLALVSLALGMSGAEAATKVTVTPQFKVSHTKSEVTLTFKGLPATHGIYVTQCMAPDKGKAPTSCDPSETSKVWVSNIAADQKVGAVSGNGKVKLKVDAYFKGGDCIHTTCVLFVTSDHNAPTDRSEDQVIPFKFS
jgi:hypothetical protein